MSTITLEDIKNFQKDLADMIAAYEAQAAASEYTFPETRISLRPGEAYAGLIIGDDEAIPSHHLILMDGEVESSNWEDAQAWARALGGELPNRREQSLLFANCRDQFETAWYWSSAAAGAGYAWYQDFGYGYQGNDGTDDELRARAVRRLTI